MTMPMTTVGLVGVGHMGSGLGWALREGGHEVVTTLAGRSPRSGRLAHRAGVAVLPDLAAVVRASAVVLVVTPPDAALDAATAIVTACRATGAQPIVADLNATSPETMQRIATTVGPDLVDGSISGPPPNVRPGARIFLSGPRAAEVAALSWRHVTPIVVGDRVGTASAVKMCTASVYKGTTAVVTQAVRAAAYYGVADHVLTDLKSAGIEPAVDIAMAATKAWRFVPEMREIAATQRGADLPGELFEAMALVYDQLAQTELARRDPEAVDRSITVDEVLHGLE
jgi:3-hydroxyisobutyrate dehydrogenase-like beta-hydroxyacid dehydrogenase